MRKTCSFPTLLRNCILKCPLNSTRWGPLFADLAPYKWPKQKISAFHWCFFFLLTPKFVELFQPILITVVFRGLLLAPLSERVTPTNPKSQRTHRLKRKKRQHFHGSMFLSTKTPKNRRVTSRDDFNPCIKITINEMSSSSTKFYHPLKILKVVSQPLSKEFIISSSLAIFASPFFVFFGIC